MAISHNYYEVQLRKLRADLSSEMWSVWFKSESKDSSTVQVSILGGSDAGIFDWDRARAEDFYKSLMSKSDSRWFVSKRVNPDAPTENAMGDSNFPKGGLGTPSLMCDEIKRRTEDDKEKFF